MSKTIVINLFGCCAKSKRKKSKARLLFRVKTGTQSFVEGKKMRMTNENEFDVEVESPKTAAGNPARLDGAARFESSDESVATVIQTGDYTATIRAVLGADLGPTGKTIQVVARADADLGEGVREIVGTMAVEVVPAEAATFELKAGEVRLSPQPEAVGS